MAKEDYSKSGNGHAGEREMKVREMRWALTTDPERRTLPVKDES
jgi:hypothetical protein